MQNSPAAFIIFLITIGLSFYALYFQPELLDKFSLAPYYIKRGKRYFTLVTSGFIHADLGHLLFNMFTFYFFAFNLEKIVGTPIFVIIYFAALILSDIQTIFQNKDNVAYRSLGASGAISALLFSFILFYPKSKITIFPIPIPLPAWIYAILFVVYSYYASGRSHGINHSAHLWGAIVGLILTLILVPESLTIFLSNF